MIKFRSIIMILWILKDWKIPNKSLKQSIENSENDVLIFCKLTKQTIR